MTQTQPSPSRDERATLTIDEAATILGVARGTAFSAARRGEIPTVRIGRRLLVPSRPFFRMLDFPTST